MAAQRRASTGLNGVAFTKSKVGPMLILLLTTYLPESPTTGPTPTTYTTNTRLTRSLTSNADSLRARTSR